MNEWNKNVQTIVGEIDFCIKSHSDEELTLKRLAKTLG